MTILLFPFIMPETFRSKVLSVHRMPVLRMKLLIKIGNKMPVAIVER